MLFLIQPRSRNMPPINFRPLRLRESYSLHFILAFNVDQRIFPAANWHRLVPIFYKTCQICSGDDPTKPFLVDERAWTAHLVSRTHRRAVKGSQPPIDWNVIRTEAREKAQEKEKQLKISQASILEV